MHENIQAALDRADIILNDLEASYKSSLGSKNISPDTKQLCHDVLEKLKSSLDRSARRYFDKYIADYISEDDRNSATVYFPISSTEHSFSSTMGRWRWKSVKESHNNLELYLISLQPYYNERNKWLGQLNELVNEGKHIDLAPQIKTEAKNITVSKKGSGSVSYGPGVIFGEGVKIMGVPIDPKTQRVVPGDGVHESIVIWVDFLFQNQGVSALGFCRHALNATKKIITDLDHNFDLS